MFTAKARTPANKVKKILNIVSPGNISLVIPGKKCPNSETEVRIIFRHFQSMFKC